MQDVDKDLNKDAVAGARREEWRYTRGRTMTQTRGVIGECGGHRRNRQNEEEVAREEDGSVNIRGVAQSEERPSAPDPATLDNLENSQDSSKRMTWRNNGPITLPVDRNNRLRGPRPPTLSAPRLTYFWILPLQRCRHFSHHLFTGVAFY